MIYGRVTGSVQRVGGCKWKRFRAQAGVLVTRELRALERELQAGIDARMHRIGRDGGYRDLRDFGPGLRIERGDVIREFRPDPTIPDREVLIRGGRVYDCIRFMYDKGMIT
jgi:hypothetical protein